MIYVTTKLPVGAEMIYQTESKLTGSASRSLQGLSLAAGGPGKNGNPLAP